MSHDPRSTRSDHRVDESIDSRCHRRYLRPLLPVLLCLAWQTTAFAQAPEAPALEMEPYAFENHDGTTVQAELGRLTVPENRHRPDSRSIELSFVRFPSTAEKPGPPIVYLAGGPGGSGITTARYSRFPLFMALRKFGDVIAFDQRGTGLSGGSDMRCRETYQLPTDQPGDAASASAIMQVAVRRCAERLQGEGVDISGYTSEQSAADLNDLRRALGAEKISLWGISYGSHLSLAMLGRYGQYVDRVILAGLEGLDQTFKLPVDQQALLEDIARLAAADPEIRRAVPDLLASLETILQRLDKEPVTVPTVHPMMGVELPVRLGSFEVKVTVAALLRGPETFRFLPDLIARMEQGDFMPLALLNLMESQGTPGSMMSLAMDCASSASPERLATIRQQAARTLLGDAINFPMPSICDAVPVEPLSDAFRQPLESSVPALLISGTLDGRTPVHNGDDLLPGLSRAHHLVLEGAGHSDPLFLSSPKILETMERFLSGKDIGLDRLAVDYPPLVAPRQLAQIPDAAYDRFVGTFRDPEGKELRILRAGSVLFMMSGRRPQMLRPESELRLFYELENRGVELQLDDAEVTGIRLIDEDSGDVTVATKI